MIEALEASSQVDEKAYERFVSSGDQASFEALVDRWHATAYRVACCICRNGSLAEEAVQDAFLELYSCRSRFEDRGPGSFRSWFLSLVTNRARMVRRSERRAEARKEVNPDDYASRKGLDQKKDKAEGEWIGDLQRTLASIEEEWRTPVVLHFIGGLQQTEVASMLGVTQQTVSRRIARGLEQLRTRLSKAGFAVSATALTEALTAGDWLKVPTHLGSNVVNASKATTPAEVARALAESSRMVSRRAGAAWGGGVKAVYLLLATAAIAGGAFWLAREAAFVPKQATPAASDATASSDEGFHHVWTFEEGPPDDFSVIDGEWNWVELSSLRGMTTPWNRHVLAVPPVRPAKGPMLLSMTVDLDRKSIRKPTGFNSAVFYVGNDGKLLPHRCWSRTVNIPRRAFSHQAYLLDDCIVKLFKGRIQSIRKFDSSSTTRLPAVFFVNWVMTRVELRSLRPEEIPEEFRDIDRLIERHGLQLENWKPWSVRRSEKSGT